MTMIVIAGIPGTGKSSTAKALSKSIGATVFWNLRKKNGLKLLKIEKLMDYSQESRGFVV